MPISCGLNISITMICAGIGTIAFYFIAKKKVPVFLGSSIAFLTGYCNIMGNGINEANGETLANLYTTNYELWCTNLGKLVVALWVAGILYAIFSYVIKLVGVEKIKKIFSPIVVGPVVMLIGFGLCQTMFKNDIVLQISDANPAWKVWTCAIITMVTILAINAYCKDSSIFKIMPIICGFVVGTVYALIIGYDFSVEFSGSVTIFEDIFSEKSVLGFWKHLAFDGNAMIQILPVALVSMMEHLGDISANSLACHKDFMIDPGVNRTILGDGTATFIAGLLGGPANTTYSENTAILVMTNNFKPANMVLASVFAILLGIFVPFGEVIKAIPTPVIGGASIVLFGMIAASGLRNLIENKIDLGQTKNLLVVSFTLAVGLGFNAINGLTIGDVNISALCIATFVAIILNVIIPKSKENSNTVENTEITQTVENKTEEKVVSYYDVQKEKNKQKLCERDVSKSVR